jgi:hyperosmotically inducible protein
MKVQYIPALAFACALVALPATVRAAGDQPSTQDNPGTIDTMGDAAGSVSHSAQGAAETVEHSTEGAVGTVVGTTKDVYVVSTVKSKLAASDQTSAAAIDVDSDDGVVTLSGTVPTEDAKDAAEKIASNVQGVSSVKNDLRVSEKPMEESD